MKLMSLIVATASLVTTTAMAQVAPVVAKNTVDTKPAAYNAPVSKKVAAHTLTCDAEHRVTLRSVDLEHIEIAVDGEKALLKRNNYNNWGVIYTKSERNNAIKYKSVANDAGVSASWKEYDNYGKLRFQNVEGKFVNTRCEFATM